jgi:hypothetical protein
MIKHRAALILVWLVLTYGRQTKTIHVQPGQYYLGQQFHFNGYVWTVKRIA